jgi:hypothetical protein
LEDGQVAFRYPGHADEGRLKTMTLSAAEFRRRFVPHVLPKGFVKVRPDGVLADRPREDKLAVCRQWLPVATVAAPRAAGEPAEPPVIEPARLRSGPRCGRRRLILVRVPDAASGPASGTPP